MTFTQIITLNYTNIFEFDWFFDTNTVKPSFLHLPEFGTIGALERTPEVSVPCNFQRISNPGICQII